LGKSKSQALASGLARAYEGGMASDTTLTEFLDALGDGVATGRFVSANLSKPTAQAGDLTAIDIRPIMVKRELKLSFTYHHRTRDVVKNLPPHEGLTMLRALLMEQFTAARLCTTQADTALKKTPTGFALTRHPPTHTTPPDMSHDRAKQRLITSADKPYLHALGIADAKGAVYKNAQDKFRQINKYIEVLDGLLKQLAPRETLRIVDMGAGKGYLTFALYDHLVHNLKRSAEIIGVEYRADLVAQCNAIAQAAQFKGLRFVQGSIADHDCAGADIVIALHACDTATDDAIAKAVRAGASLIVVAPCCHKQIRREMDKADAPSPLPFLMRYGTYVERIAEMVTDGLRAQLMEMQGYRTNLFEFISDAHTPKNVMIVATKLAAPPSDTAALRAQIAETKAQFGISYHALERALAK
jgi:SAM-dependent methyltransferase